MKPGIHPAHCPVALRVEVADAASPTLPRALDTAGRAERFERRYALRGAN
ncbi:hypothetical protein OG230_27265 [Streptomyces sp. NBC_00234]|nr:hypothetical protein [Streptomyces sp. NBC_00234]